MITELRYVKIFVELSQDYEKAKYERAGSRLHLATPSEAIRAG